MTTFFCKPSGHRGQGRQRMGVPGKVTPQVSLSFPVGGGPPILDSAPPPVPTPPKPRSSRNSWPGQMWNHLTSMFTSQPTVYWVNPHVMGEGPPPHMAQFATPPHQFPMTPPALNPGGGGLWHPAPPGNQQQQMMMDPLLMLQGNEMNQHFQAATKTQDQGCFYPASKMDTSGYSPAAKMETGCAYPAPKEDWNTYFRATKVHANGYIPTAKAETSGLFEMPDTNIQAQTPWPSTAGTSKPLNPNAQEWVPPGYMTSPMPGPASIITVPLELKEEVVEVPDQDYQHQHSTPVIPYSPQDFKVEEEVQVRASLPVLSTLIPPAGSGLECQSSVTLLSPSAPLTGGVSAGSETGSPCLSSGSKTPVISPAVQSPVAEKTKRAGVTPTPQSPASPGASGRAVSPDQKQVCVGHPARLDSVKNAGMDLAKSRPDTISGSARPHLDQQGSSGSPQQDQQVCGKVLSSLDCGKSVDVDPDQPDRLPASRLQSPEGQSPVQTLNNATGACKASSASETCIPNSECQTPHQCCHNNTTQQQQQKRWQAEGLDVVHLQVPVGVQEGLESARVELQGANKNRGPSVSYARVVERLTPSPPPPPPPPEQEKYRGVEQPIPKIFQRDRTPPREVPAPKVEDQRVPELFRRPSKCQRVRSRKFLQELKESSQNSGDDGAWCVSSSPSSVTSSSSSSSSSELSQSPHIIPSSSFSSTSSSSSRTLPSSPSSPLSISPLRCVLPLARSTPQATPTSPGTPNGPAESPGRVRSESESSTASLDIDFVDEVDRAPFAHPPATPTSTSTTRRPINRFLACILGSGDSDSEEEEDWDDWDEVCVEEGEFAAAPNDLDDSWETFGMVLLQCQPEPVQRAAPEGECQNGQSAQCQAGTKVQCRIDLSVQCQNVPATDSQSDDARTEDQCDPSYLAEVNERWERESGPGTQQKSATRVTFGSATVHPMVVWGHAYREARRGPWEQQARDRARFRERIRTTEKELSRVLQAGHRTAMYERLHAPTTTTTTTIATAAATSIPITVATPS